MFIDESRTYSSTNEWSKRAQQLAELGAHAVLLTATPIREDGEEIPGFETEPIHEDEFTVTVANPRKEAPENFIWVQLQRRKRRLLRLRAHHITTFGDAWNQERPSPLCQISRLAFDLDLTHTIGESYK